MLDDEPRSAERRRTDGRGAGDRPASGGAVARLPRACLRERLRMPASLPSATDLIEVVREFLEREILPALSGGPAVPPAGRHQSAGDRPARARTRPGAPRRGVRAPACRAAGGRHAHDLSFVEALLVHGNLPFSNGRASGFRDHGETLPENLLTCRSELLWVGAWQPSNPEGGPSDARHSSCIAGAYAASEQERVFPVVTGCRAPRGRHASGSHLVRAAPSIFPPDVACQARTSDRALPWVSALSPR